MTDLPYEPHDDADSLGGDRPLQPGTQLGAYKLEEPIGQGGMGFVWKAWDAAGERHVAVKLLPPNVRHQAETLAQVKTVFQIVHALTHQHIGKTIGLSADPRSGTYVVMDYLPGITLAKFAREYRKQHGSLSLKLVVRLLTPVAQALDYAHRKGVLHRDVKPLNILVEVREGRPEEVWLIDFGLAAVIRNESSKGMDQRTDSSGTLEYQSPEQLKGKRSLWNGQSDQYSLAVVAYELLAGQLPFEGPAEVLMYAIFNEEPDPLATQPESVNQALLKALSKQKEERFATCQEFVSALLATPAQQVTPQPKPAPESPIFDERPTETEFDVSDFYIIPDLPERNSPPKPKTTARLATPATRLQGSKAGDVLELAERRFRWCPAGTFTMGTLWATDDETPVSVTLTKGFWLCETTVTQGQWQGAMATTPWQGQQYVTEGPRYPATDVNWDDAVSYCGKLTGQARSAGRLPAGWKYTLPTEAQWEYACRAGTTTEYSFGDSDNQLGLYAWYDKNAHGIGENYAHEVGQKRANPWGLYDMHGNVWEWCSDWYGGNLPGGRDPVGPSAGSYRVSRGGSWGSGPPHCWSAYRDRHGPGGRDNDLGFRVALVPSSE